MIQNLDRQTLMRLAGHEGFPAISLFMPTNRTGAEREQDQLRMKNLLGDAASKLAEAGMRSTDAEALLAGARALQKDASFWRELGSGLAVFAVPGETLWMKVPTTLPAEVVLGPRFYIRPLMPAWENAHPFYILAVSQEKARLLRGNPTGAEEIDLPEKTPTSLDEELKYDVVQEDLQFRSRSEGGTATGAMYHGHGGEKDARRTNLTRYLVALEKGVSETLGRENSVPLVLAGVDYVLDIYRAANSYPGLVDVRISGNTDDMSMDKLNAAGLTLLDPLFEGPVKKDLADLASKEGTGFTSREVAEIVPAAMEGRVKSLLLSDGVGPLGSFDTTSLGVEVHAPAEPRYLRERMDAMGGESPNQCEWDLVDLAIAYTLSRDGEVHAFVGENAPVEGVAAIFRY